MYEIFSDLHIHIGRAESGKPVKITGARSLNFANIAKECYYKKGIQVARNYRLCVSLCNRRYRKFFKFRRCIRIKRWWNYI